MKEIECRKGFTLVEMMCVIAIIGILAAWIIPMVVSNANGAEYNFVTHLATDANIKEAAALLHGDPNLKVKVMTYIADWTFDNLDAHMDKAQEIANKLEMLGITNINMLYANKLGLDTYSGPTSLVAPAHDGVYLVLSY